MKQINFENIAPLDFASREAYKTLRSNIQFCGDDIKVISVTSCLPNEGKSVLTFHLAAAMAEAEKKVLMIDADIRKSVMLNRFQADRVEKGLSEYLTGQCLLDDCLCKTNIKNMDVIFTGPVAPNPSEILGSKKFADLLVQMREQYDYVLLDCPPLGSVIDAAVVSAKADGAILVIQSDMVSYQFAQQVKNQLEMSGCRILGAVLNKIDNEKGNYYSRYGKYYTKRYGYSRDYGYGYEDKNHPEGGKKGKKRKKG
ncbi:MAG: CpsD/CapB family tyrosine-protein kinase [Candidatus Limivivens sp.]|nr:CpsD/CapB family tyrosine-protein kinase [Candidatus Limivivens sp.]